MNIVLFSQDEISQPLPMNDVRAKHIMRILKKKEGESFAAGIEGGRAGSARITSVTDEGIDFDFTEESDGKPLYPLHIIVGFPRPIQLRRLFRDAAGLGVCEICLCGTDTGEKSYAQTALVRDGAAHELLREGSAQAKSTHVPSLSLYTSLDQVLGERFSPPDGGERIALDTVLPEISLSALLMSRRAEDLALQGVWAAIGSERGWSDRERALFKDWGFSLCSLGTRILRTETAVTAASVLIISSMGLL